MVTNMKWYKTEKGFEASIDLGETSRIYDIQECEALDRNVLLSKNMKPLHWFFGVEDAKLFVKLLEEGKR